MKLLSVVFSALLSLQLTSANFPKYSFFDILTGKDSIEKLLPKDVKIRPSVEYRSIQQRVNHFNPQDLRTFTNFYVISEELFQPGGPLIFFFYINQVANGLAGQAYASYGPVYDFAAQLNGTIIAPEHRYYENSVVTEDLSDENLRFLTIGQSLEDLAHLITSLKSEERFKDSGVILIGWDYGASYATWFAQKFPHLVNGIWASGARTHQSLEQNQIVEVVENITRTFGSEQCYARSSNAFRQLEEMMANNQSRIIERTFRLCFPLPYNDGNLDRWIFFNILSSYFYTYAQIFEEINFRNSVCGELENAPVANDFEAFAHVLGFTSIPAPLCYPISFNRDVELLKETELLTAYAPTRTLYYQYCNEFGFYWNSGSGTTFFGDNFPLELFIETCRHLFGITRDQFDTNLARFNVLYGGRNPGIRNAYFTYGELYPWIDFGIDAAGLHSSSTFEVIPNRSLDTELALGNDNQELAAVRGRILTAAKRWLGINEEEINSN